MDDRVTPFVETTINQSGDAFPDRREHFYAKWIPVRVQKTRKNKKIESRSDLIGVENALDRLTALGWQGGRAAIVIGMIVSFFLFGYFAIYWRNADMDFMIVYNALALNDGRPQEFFDHPSFFTILSVEFFFRFLHAIGLLNESSLSAIPSATIVPAFDIAMTHAVRAGRIVALGTGIVVVLSFAALMRRVVQDWRIALLATFAFAFSGGVAVHIRILRSEMIAASLVTFALMMLIIVARRGSIWRPVVLAVAASLCVFALENKVHVILLIAALPVFGLAFGASTGASVTFWRNSPFAWPAVLLAMVVALLLAWSAHFIVIAGFDPVNTEAAELRPLLFGAFGVYQCALLLYVGFAMMAFAAIHHVSVKETFAAIFAVVAGAMIGLLALNLQFNAGNAVAVLNPLEKMVTFSNLPSDGMSDIKYHFMLLESNFLSVLKRYTFFLHSSPRPTIVLIWLIVPGIFYAWMRDKKRVALQAFLLMLVAAGVDTLGVSRGLKAEYFILTDPLIIIAGALLLDEMPQLAKMRGAFVVGVAIFVVHIVLSQPEPIKMMTKRSGPEYICEWNKIYQKHLPMPWCAHPAAQP